jgi:ATP-dependent protease ClpP protease subunit
MSILTRRGTLLLLGAAAIPAASRADGVPSVPPPVPPEPVPAVPAVPSVVPPPQAPRSPPPLVNGIDKSKAYFLFFEQNIDVNSMRTLRKQLVALTEAGVTEITIVLSSPGGLVVAALNAFGFINALPARINTHAQGWVASAATVLFLAGQQRSADRNAQFLFHPSVSQLQGGLSERQLQDQLTMLGDVDSAVATILRERTKLTDAEIARFQRETVIFDTGAALAKQIVHSVEDLRIPGDQKARVLFVE